MKKSGINRRKFLRNSTMGAIGAGILGGEAMGIPAGTDKDEKIKDYRVFGRTGFKVSDISCGFSQEESIIRAMLDKGANLVETSEIYNNGNHERLIGKILKDYEREEIFVVTKIHYKSGPMDSKSEIISRFNKSLERLDTEYIDGYMIHAAQGSADIRNRNFHAAFKELKRSGKVRFAGVSCHGSSYFDNPEESMEQVIGSAIEDGRFDFVEFIYNFFEPEMGARILNKCGENNIGAMIMKSSPVYLFEVYKNILDKALKEGIEVTTRTQNYYDKYGKQAETAEKFFAKYGITDQPEIRKAALQFVLSNSSVSTVPVVAANVNDIDFHIGVSGTKLETRNMALLSTFNNIAGFLNCRIGCDICESSCPDNLPVNTILRYNYYYMSKKEEKYAMLLYSDLPGGKPDACLNCEGYCENACPYGVMARPLLAMAHKNLSFNDLPVT